MLGMKFIRKLEAVVMFLGGLAMVFAPIAQHVWWPFMVLGTVSGASISILSIGVWIIAGELEQAESGLRADYQKR